MVMFREYGDEMVRIFIIGDENGDVYYGDVLLYVVVFCILGRVVH
jgi:hypothetical protein